VQASDTGIDVAFTVSHVTLPGASDKPTALYFDQQARRAALHARTTERAFAFAAM
jgi:hypothetical protein